MVFILNFHILLYNNNINNNNNNNIIKHARVSINDGRTAYYCSYIYIYNYYKYGV